MRNDNYNGKIYLSHNVCLNVSYDLNILKEGLIKANYKIVNRVVQADILIYAGCGVRGVWVDEAIREINTLLNFKKDLEVIITGCVSNIEPERMKTELNAEHVYLRTFSEILFQYTPYTFEEIDVILSQNENTIFDDVNGIRSKLSDSKRKVLEYLKIIDSDFNTKLSDIYRDCTKGFVFYNYEIPIEYITISRGCLFNCSFCAIPSGRGKYSSVPPEIIYNKVKNCLRKGTKSILLVGDEVGNYGIDRKNVNIVKLINSILSFDSEIKLGIRYIVD